MASAIRSYGSCLAVLLALAALRSPRVIGASAAPESGGPRWHVVSISSLLPSTVCTAAEAAPSSSAVRVVHRHGPCSPVPPRGDPPSPLDILDRDQERVDSIHRKIAGASAAVTTSLSTKAAVTLPTRRGASLGTNNYVFSVGLGTPARTFWVELDTGSDLSWVQCKPCNDCYEQQDPLFDPARSSTFSAVPCGARECQELDSRTCSRDNTCRYEYDYADFSRTDGKLVRDRLTLAASHEIPGFVFGCGDDDNGTFARTDGLFGLGRAKLSLASQAATRYGAGAGFSYCLPSSASATGYLSLSAAAPPANARFTGMVTRSDAPSLYFLNLVGVEVAGRKVEIPPAVFATTPTIIDSGTVFSRLPQPAYDALRSAFTRAMDQLRYKRAPALSFLDTCYDFTGRTRVRIPSVALVFADGTKLSLGPRGVLYVWSVGQTCLAFVPIGNDTVGILGNMQQRTVAVIYDVANQRIGFGARGCS
ncbi:hypothetical protein EJB05_43486, partial [Eragrostis curvula]